jgi:hypothetical protein
VTETHRPGAQQAPGAPTENTPGWTPRVQQIVAKNNGQRQAADVCDKCGPALERPESIARRRCRECQLIHGYER